MAIEGLSKWSGEFAAPEREAAFRQYLFAENLRYAKIAFLLSAVLNSLFIVSDWRFAGTPHFWIAIPARLLVVFAAIGCYALARRAKRPEALEAALFAWMALTAIGVSLLVTAHTDVALFSVLLLPLLYYLAIPCNFRSTLICGIGASLVLLAAFMLPNPPPTTFGLIMVVACMNTGLALAAARSNRLRRMEWAAGAELEQSRAALDSLFNAAPVPLLVTRFESGELVRSNEAGFQFFGTTPETMGRAEEGYADPATRAYLLEQVERLGRINSFETRMRLADGSIRDVLMAATRVTVDGEDCLMTGIVDITTRKVLEAHLEQMARTDSLTGLANRARFFETAEEEVRRASRSGRHPSLLMIDLDHFKGINDQYGHEAGDQALKAFADLAVGMVRDHDTVARLGGEEFAILLPEADLTAAARMAERLRVAAELMRIDPLPALRLTISIGVARVEAGELAVDPALSRADRALYRAKRSGRNRVSAADRRLDIDDGSRPG